mmetsp:Transcript_10477/g.17741  ORF Transcript_10477/g.17741 Transcript_10477/m.17741 type:complete len:312 (+) Transcript_10477:60-995(+)
MLSRFSRLVRIPGVLALTSSRVMASTDVSHRWRTEGHALASKNPEYASRDKKLHSMLKATIPEALEHTGTAAFDEHLTSLQAVMRSWVPGDEEMSDAALFHSIYGTEGFGGYALPWSERPAIRSLIGTRAERYAWLFCVMDRTTFDGSVLGVEDPEALARLPLPVDPHAALPLTACAATLSKPGDPRRLTGFRARPELGGFPLELRDEGEWLDMATLTLADFLEQVEGAASKENKNYDWPVGGAWGYRRHLYQALAHILQEERGLDKALEMYKAVYGQEPLENRSLHLTSRTPPLTDAAKTAFAARESMRM